MKTRRTFAFWLTLALCATTVLGAMSWLTRSVLDAERERLIAQRDRSAAEARADLEERTRLALWRMDALGAATLLNIGKHGTAESQSDPYSVPPTDPEIRLWFLTLNGSDLLEPSVKSALPETASRLQQLEKLLKEHPLPDDWKSDLEAEVNRRAIPPPAQKPLLSNNSLLRQQFPADQLRNDYNYQLEGNRAEYQQRAKAVEQTVTGNKAQLPEDTSLGMKSANAPASALAQSAADSQQKTETIIQSDEKGATQLEEQKTLEAELSLPTWEPMRPVWLGAELLLLRKTLRGPADAPIKSTSRIFLQGVWLNAEILTSNLLHEVADLLPQARLVPAMNGQAAEDPLALVSFPFKLERGETPLATAVATTPTIGAPLWVAWGGVLCAFLTLAALMHGVMQLSERRASFVSAVTHELRTPLTTFRLYSDMLEQDAVKPEKRGSYLRVLSREADRLSHLVENVLAFSRIERGNARSNLREISVAEMLESFRERYEARLATAGLELTIHSAADLRLRSDLAAVDHILFNLIDNAAKYASGSMPAMVKIRANSAGSFIDISVADHGPGIPNDERRRIFKPFHKSAREAAESQPGVGLGLALSRRLARAQGGDLTIAETRVGACFIIRLPRGV